MHVLVDTPVTLPSTDRYFFLSGGGFKLCADDTISVTCKRANVFVYGNPFSSVFFCFFFIKKAGPHTNRQKTKNNRGGNSQHTTNSQDNTQQPGTKHTAHSTQDSIDATQPNRSTIVYHPQAPIILSMRAGYKNFGELADYSRGSCAKE